MGGGCGGDAGGEGSGDADGEGGECVQRRGARGGAEARRARRSVARVPAPTRARGHALGGCAPRISEARAAKKKYSTHTFPPALPPRSTTPRLFCLATHASGELRNWVCRDTRNRARKRRSRHCHTSTEHRGRSEALESRRLSERARAAKRAESAKVTKAAMPAQR